MACTLKPGSLHSESLMHSRVLPVYSTWILEYAQLTGVETSRVSFRKLFIGVQFLFFDSEVHIGDSSLRLYFDAI